MGLQAAVEEEKVRIEQPLGSTERCPKDIRGEGEMQEEKWRDWVPEAENGWTQHEQEQTVELRQPHRQRGERERPEGDVRPRAVSDEQGVGDRTRKLLRELRERGNCISSESGDAWDDVSCHGGFFGGIVMQWPNAFAEGDSDQVSRNSMASMARSLLASMQLTQMMLSKQDPMTSPSANQRTDVVRRHSVAEIPANHRPRRYRYLPAG